MIVNPADIQRKKQVAISQFSRAHFMEAKQSCEEIIRLDPSDAVIMCLLGVIYGSLKQYSKSAEYLYKSIELDPEYVEAHYNLGIALRQLGKVEEAGRELEYVIASNGEHANALVALGYVKMSCGEYQQAIDCYHSVQRLQPSRVDAVAGEAEIYEKQGDVERAYELIHPYIQEGLKDAELAVVYGKLARKLDDASDAIKHLESFIDGTEVPPDALLRLHFILGDLYDGIGDYDAAFYYYRRGNSAKGVYFDSYKYSSAVDQQIRRFSQSNLERLPRSTCRSKLPVFIVGMPRSGTSLVEQILSSHKDVYGAGELSDIRKLVEPLAREKRYGAHNLDIVSMITTAQLDEVAGCYLDKLDRLSPDALRITDKMPGNFQNLGFIELLFPGARVIHCRRNAIDTCLSCYFQNFAAIHDYSFKLEDVANYYINYHKLMDHWRQVLQIPLHEVEYEQLVEDPDREVRKIIAFIGLDWDEQCLKYYERRRTIRTASYSQASKPIYRKSVNRWRNYEKDITQLTSLLEGYI